MANIPDFDDLPKVEGMPQGECHLMRRTGYLAGENVSCYCRIAGRSSTTHAPEREIFVSTSTKSNSDLGVSLSPVNVGDQSNGDTTVAQAQPAAPESSVHHLPSPRTSFPTPSPPTDTPPSQAAPGASSTKTERKTSSAPSTSSPPK